MKPYKDKTLARKLGMGTLASAFAMTILPGAIANASSNVSGKKMQSVCG